MLPMMVLKNQFIKKSLFKAVVDFVKNVIRNPYFRNKNPPKIRLF